MEDQDPRREEPEPERAPLGRPEQEQENGTAKCPKQERPAQVFQVPERRVMYQPVSSGKLAYQIRKYWQKAM